MRKKGCDRLAKHYATIENDLIQIIKDFDKTTSGVKKARRRVRAKLLRIMKQAKAARAVILYEAKLEVLAKEKT